MGVHENIGPKKFPKQGSNYRWRVRVCFNYDTDNQVLGVIVRDDTEPPHKLIIALDDGRFVEADECQYQPIAKATRCLCWAECKCEMAGTALFVEEDA